MDQRSQHAALEATAVDLRVEQLFTLSELARKLPRRRGGRPVAPSTLYRWTKRGLRGVVLESVQVGGTLCSSEEALMRFFERLRSARPAVVDQHHDAHVDSVLERSGIVTPRGEEAMP